MKKELLLEQNISIISDNLLIREIHLAFLLLLAGVFSLSAMFDLRWL